MTVKWIADEKIGEVQETGLFTRAASYGASMINAYFMDQLIESGKEANEIEILEILGIEEKLIPTLEALGFIGFFTIDEWLSSERLGRLAIAFLYLRKNPELIDTVRDRLVSLAERSEFRRLFEMIPLAVNPADENLPKQLSAAAAPADSKFRLAVDPEHLIPSDKQGWTTDEGIFYRKGTSLATMDNCRQYQDAITGGVSDRFAPPLSAAINDQQFITNMMAAGIFFSFFPPIEWLSDHLKEGRMLPALLLLQQHPEMIDDQILHRLEQLIAMVGPVTRELIKEVQHAAESYREKLIAVERIVREKVRDFSMLVGLGTKSKTANGVAISSTSERRVDLSKLLWQSSSTSLYSQRLGGMIKGVEQIQSFCAKDDALKETALDLAAGSYVIELEKGIARASVPIHSDSTGILECQLRRIAYPSCRDVESGYSDDWRCGEWRIWTWFELSGSANQESV